MKISSRELGLLFATLVALVLGLSYWWAEPRLKALEEREAALDLLERERQLAAHEMSRQHEWQAQLDAFRESLPQHDPDARVTADLLRMIERIARETNLDLLRREPEDERVLGDLYEVSINCMWEGSLDALVRFLFAIQSQGAVLDIRTLQVAPVPNNTERLRGRFTIDCAYSRVQKAEPTETQPEGS